MQEDDSKEYSILKVTKNGLKVTLFDGSRWQINEGDSTMSICWYPTMRVCISEDLDDKLYPYRLTNIDTSSPDVVKARRI